MKETSITTPLVSAIELAWSAIQAEHDDVPDVVITLGSGLVRQGMKLGHFAANVWTHGDKDVHELFVGGEGLARGAAPLMATLIHEAAHAWAEANGIKDTSRQGRYHNDKFRLIGETFGLKLQKSESLGWSASEITEDAAKLYEDVILALDLALTAYRKGPRLVQLPTTGTGTVKLPNTTSGRTSSNNGVSAHCACGRRIRVSQTVLDMGDITCSVCGEAFA